MDDGARQAEQRWRPGRPSVLSALRAAILLACGLTIALPALPALAQQAVPSWKSDLDILRRIDPPAVPPATPAVPAPPAEAAAPPALRPATPDAARADTAAKAELTLSVFLTQDGEPIDQGVIWRIYREPAAGETTRPVLIGTYREATPVVPLDTGAYLVNVAFGRAHLTRKLTIPKPGPVEERFVLNAGGLRVITALANGEQPPDLAAGYDVYQGDTDQLGGRTKIVGGVRPGLILRLNAGLYHIVSTLGDANAVVSADVTVEAGKLTDAIVRHHAARITLKLVTRAGGDAQADTQWAVHTAQGELVRESQGALPSHVLAAGQYVASARHGGKLYQRQFTVTAGDSTQVEIVMQ